MARTLGINPFTGWSITSSTWSGYTAGDNASKYTQDVDFDDIDFGYVADKATKFFAPLDNNLNENPDQVVYQLQKALFPADVLIIMSDTKLEEALANVIKIRDEKVPALKATDVRTLVKVKEVQTMTLAAEMSLRGAIMRKECRPNVYYREDYPSPDNENWLKWILVQKGENGNMDFSTQNIPFEQYKFKPEGR